ncbi:hypothetical protein Tco_0492467 [Tanacetum coccineum]
MKDKNIAISELKKLIENCKGKSVETQFNKPSVVRQPNAQRIPKPSVLGKPTPFSNSPEMRSFQTKQSVNKTNVSDGLFKQVTQQNLPQIRKQAVRNTNVIAPGPSRNCPKHVSHQSPREKVGSNDMVHNYYLEKAKKSAQLRKNKDAKSHRRKEIYAVEKSSAFKKPGEDRSHKNRFSNKNKDYHCSMRTLTPLDLVLVETARVEFSRQLVLDGFLLERYSPLALASSSLGHQCQMVSAENNTSGPNSEFTTTTMNVEVQAGSKSCSSSSQDSYIMTRVGITIPPSHSNAEDNSHKVVRLGINPMIQPEPEDLPKDNPKLEIAVLRYQPIYDEEAMAEVISEYSTCYNPNKGRSRHHNDMAFCWKINTSALFLSVQLTSVSHQFRPSSSSKTSAHKPFRTRNSRPTSYEQSSSMLVPQTLFLSHKVVRLGINPMIQPEPEDLPKDNPKLEIAVLRWQSAQASEY